MGVSTSHATTGPRRRLVLGVLASVTMTMGLAATPAAHATYPGARG